MFDQGKPRFLRALSLFHVVLPIVLLWMVNRLGYDDRALLFQTVVAQVVLPVTWWITAPADNVNWVYGPGSEPQTRMHPRAYLAVTMILFPLVFYLPTHVVLRLVLGRT